MKLYYYQSPTGLRNFGDDLNKWLWPRLIPGILDDNAVTIFLGFGTLLNDGLKDRLPNGHRKMAVFSSGVGYGTGVPTVDDSWKIYCVRGPLSAQALGLEPGLAVTDGAALIRRLCGPQDQKLYRYSYMPHAIHAQEAGPVWDSVCKEIGFGYVDPRWSVEEVLSAISQTNVLVTEAMHGAIVADALRVPWIAVRSTKAILSYKWRDWCMSIGVDYEPKHLLPLWDTPQYPSIARVMRYSIKKKLISWQLKKIARDSRPILSAEMILESRIVALEERLQDFRDDAARGVFM